ncbi:NADH-quinone oxidoreductase subunit N [Thermanaerothrix daxensis]|uniref:NADH-quinone oxidoreductase subunit N n=1 Tax=Thermanaerothrix daxensis TaxID=869279 RepID=UPI0006C92F02|nr:NADH-quinone oxidoreductase subunit N [Thermanaerothrix daxensis]
MVASTLPVEYIRALLPEIGLLVLAGLVLGLDLFSSEVSRQRWLGWVVAAGSLGIAGLSLAFAYPVASPRLLWGGALRLDEVGFVFRMLFLAGVGLTALFAMQVKDLAGKGEFFALLLFSALGFSLMASAADMVMLFLAIETASIPLYVLAGFYLRDIRSAEAGLKYVLFGAVASATLLYGLSLLYGMGGTTRLYDLEAALRQAQAPLEMVAVALFLVLVGFGFKVAAVPFHFWAPDVYEGAPTPVTGYLSTASKAAGFAVLLRFLIGVFAEQTAFWTLLIGILATASMLVGNYLALVQSNAKRLLAYSSIAQAGYILIGVAAGTPLGATGAVYYLIAYLVTNLAAFGILTVVEQVLGSSDLKALEGLQQRSAPLALAMLAALLSLGGIPPFAGFIAKLLVFGSAVEAGQIWLAFVGVFNSIIALYYYLVVLRTIYRFTPGVEPISEIKPAWRLALGICVVGIVLIGVWIAPWYSWAGSVARVLWVY